MAENKLDGVLLKQALNSSIGLKWPDISSKFLAQLVTIFDKGIPADTPFKNIGSGANTVRLSEEVTRDVLQKATAEFLVNFVEGLTKDEALIREFGELASEFAEAEDSQLAAQLLQRLAGMVQQILQGTAVAQEKTEPAPLLLSLGVNSILASHKKVTDELKKFKELKFKEEDLKSLSDKIVQLQKIDVPTEETNRQLAELTALQNELAEFTKTLAETPQNLWEETAQTALPKYSEEKAAKEALDLSWMAEDKATDFVAVPPKPSIIENLWQQTWKLNKEISNVDLEDSISTGPGLFTQSITLFLDTLAEKIKKATETQKKTLDVLQARLSSAVGVTAPATPIAEGGGETQQEEEPQPLDAQQLRERWGQRRENFFDLFTQSEATLTANPQVRADFIESLNEVFDFNFAINMPADQLLDRLAQWFDRRYPQQFPPDLAAQQIAEFDQWILLFSAIMGLPEEEDVQKPEAPLKPPTPGEAAAAVPAAPPAEEPEEIDRLAQLGKITRTQFMLRELSEAFLKDELRQYFAGDENALEAYIDKEVRQQMGDIVWTEFLSQGGLTQVTFNAQTLASIAHRSAQNFAEIYRVNAGKSPNFNYLVGKKNLTENQLARTTEFISHFGFSEDELITLLSSTLQIDTFKQLQLEAAGIVGQDQIELNNALRALGRADRRKLITLLQKQQELSQEDPPRSLSPTEQAELETIIGRALPLMQFFMGRDGNLDANRAFAVLGGAEDLNSYSQTLANYQGVERRFSYAAANAGYMGNTQLAGYASPSRYAVPELAATEEDGTIVTGRNNLALEIFVVRTFIIQNQLEQAIDPEEASALFGNGYAMAMQGSQYAAQQYLVDLQNQLSDPTTRDAFLAQQRGISKQRTQQGAAGLAKSVQDVKSLQALAKGGAAATPAGLALMALSDPEFRKKMLFAAGGATAGTGLGIYAMLKPLIWLAQQAGNVINGVVGFFQGVGNFFGGILQGIFGGGAVPAAGASGAIVGMGTEFGKATAEGARQAVSQGNIIAHDLGNQVGQGLGAQGSSAAQTASTIVTVTTTQAVTASGLVVAAITGPILFTAVMTFIVFAVIGGSMNDWPMTGLISSGPGWLDTQDVACLTLNNTSFVEAGQEDQVPRILQMMTRLMQNPDSRKICSIIESKNLKVVIEVDNSWNNAGHKFLGNTHYIGLSEEYLEKAAGWKSDTYQFTLAHEIGHVLQKHENIQQVHDEAMGSNRVHSYPTKPIPPSESSAEGIAWFLITPPAIPPSEVGIPPIIYADPNNNVNLAVQYPKLQKAYRSFFDTL